MVMQILRAYSESKLLADVSRMQKLGWSAVGETYKAGLYWYQAVEKK